MIAKKFEDQVRKTPHQLAIKSGDMSMTYRELNRCANRLARLILENLENKKKAERVCLLLEHGPDMVAAILSVLKAGKVYVPLSTDYPDNRLAYMIENSESSLILTFSRHAERVKRLVRPGEIRRLFIDRDTREISNEDENPDIDIRGDHLAYIMYTSGSTGRPKGVMQNHENVLYYIRNWTRIFSITAADRMTLFSSFCHDGSVQDMLGALLNGATLFPVNVRDRTGAFGISDFLNREKITIWHSVHSLFAYFANSLTGTENFAALNRVLLGGEPIREHEIELFKNFFPHAVLANIYGQTESSVNSIWLIHPQDTIDYLTIGEPLDNTRIFVLDKEDREVKEYEVGEIMVACPHVSPGYWKDEENSKKAFSRDEEFGILYFTGDSGRLLPGGKIEFMGRRDSQVKIRGFRIELGEIESQLLRHPDIAEAVVAAKVFPAGEGSASSRGDKYLCAYVVPKKKGSQSSIDTTVLKVFLTAELPDYMIPTYFITLNSLPLTQSGKIDRKVLPVPEISAKALFEAPRNPVEKKLVEIWHVVLGVEKEKIGIDADFFELGGHSLKGTTMLSKVHREFNVQIPVAKIFQISTIRGLAGYIEKASISKYTSLKPAEKREYYAATSIQERLFVLHEIEGIETAYNIRSVVRVEGPLDIHRLGQAFKKLIRRHENLRTSFAIMDDRLVQVIHDRVDFEIDFFEAGNSREAESIIGRFIRPFILSRAPLLRVGVIKNADESHILIRDIHHIVSDGTSQVIFFREFIELYDGEELPGLNVQYKDYAQWQNTPRRQAVLKAQEEYWLRLFKDGIPELENFTDYPRPAVQDFSGDLIRLEFAEELTRKINSLAKSSGVTLYMVLLAIYNILLFKYTGCRDILIGTPLAGRNHPDVENVAGLFINALVMRNYPDNHKTAARFLDEVKRNTTAAYENQDYPFGDLLEKLGVKNDISRNPVYDVELIVQNMDFPGVETKELVLKSHPNEVNVSQVDAALYVHEVGGKLYFRLIYSTALFKRSTMVRFPAHFKEIASKIVENPDIKLQDIEISHDLQRLKSNVYSEMAANLEF